MNNIEQVTQLHTKRFQEAKSILNNILVEAKKNQHQQADYIWGGKAFGMKLSCI